MKDCLKEAYEYYHNPLCMECENEFSQLPILFGRAKQEKAIREKYKLKGLNVVRYEDFLNSKGKLKFQAHGGLKACAVFMGNGDYICGIDDSSLESCEHCRMGNNCEKLRNFLLSDLLENFLLSNLSD